VAKKKATLPASYGGIMRYDQVLGDIKLEPGHVVALVVGVAVLLVILKILG